MTSPGKRVFDSRAVLLGTNSSLSFYSCVHVARNSFCSPTNTLSYTVKANFRRRAVREGVICGNPWWSRCRLNANRCNDLRSLSVGMLDLCGAGQECFGRTIDVRTRIPWSRSLYAFQIHFNNRVIPLFLEIFAVSERRRGV